MQCSVAQCSVVQRSTTLHNAAQCSEQCSACSGAGGTSCAGAGQVEVELVARTGGRHWWQSLLVAVTTGGTAVTGELVAVRGSGS